MLDVIIHQTDTTYCITKLGSKPVCVGKSSNNTNTALLLKLCIDIMYFAFKGFHEPVKLERMKSDFVMNNRLLWLFNVLMHMKGLGCGCFLSCVFALSIMHKTKPTSYMMSSNSRSYVHLLARLQTTLIPCRYGVIISSPGSRLTSLNTFICH